MRLGPLQTKWIAALRSGEYAQDRSQLKSARGYCCLGVACVVLGLDFRRTPLGAYETKGRETAELPYSAMVTLGLDSKSGHPVGGGIGRTLAKMNDDGESFAYIADVLETKPEEYFTVSA